MYQPLCGGLENCSAHLHPLYGATYYTEDTSKNTFRLILFQGALKGDLATVFANWYMAHTYLEYADEETRAKLSRAENPAR